MSEPKSYWDDPNFWADTEAEMDQLRAEGLIPEVGHGHLSEGAICRVLETMRNHERTLEQLEARKERAKRRLEACRKMVETWARWERHETGEAEFPVGDFTIKTRKPSKAGKLVYDADRVRSFAKGFQSEGGFKLRPDLFDVKPNVSRFAKYLETEKGATGAEYVRREFPTDCTVSIKGGNDV